MMIGRRRLLRYASALAATRFLGAAAQAGVPARSAMQFDPFTLGVASGEPTSDGFVLWTRAAGFEHDVVLGYEVAEDEGFRRIVRRGQVRALATRGGAVHQEISGLRPGSHYFFRFHIGDAVSRLGKTRTIPQEPERLRLALASCQHWEQGWFTGYADMLSQDVDLVAHVGDYIYEKSFGAGPNVRRFGSPDPRTLDEYRERHALYKTDSNLAAAHANVPFVVTWDDHEVENDYAGQSGVESDDPIAFVHRRAAAYQAYFEHMPLRPGALRPDGELRLYRRSNWGKLATIHMLDTRQYRTLQPCSSIGHRGGQIVQDCSAVASPDATMLGAVQEHWLERGLAADNARWSLVTQQTLFSRLFLPAGTSAAYSDIWDGYSANRLRLTKALGAPDIRNAVILGGDVHSFWGNDVKENFDDPTSRVVASEIVTSCLASRNGPEALFGPAPALNPHVRFLDNRHAGYVLLDIDSERINADFRAVDDLADPKSVSRSLKALDIADGRPGFA